MDANEAAEPSPADRTDEAGRKYLNVRQAAFIGVAAERTASPCTLEDALEAFYVAEACELSRHRQQPVLVAEVRQ